MDKNHTITNSWKPLLNEIETDFEEFEIPHFQETVLKSRENINEADIEQW